MRKFLVFLFAVGLMFVCYSCNKSEKTAIEFVKNNLKCPSTMDVIDVESEEVEETVIIDTVYHISKIYGVKFDYIDAYASIDSVGIDSIRIVKYTYPACKKYTITYDAENAFGAMVRNKSDVYIINGEPMYFETYFFRCIQTPEEIKYDAYKCTRPLENSTLIDVGEWKKAQFI